MGFKSPSDTFGPRFAACQRVGVLRCPVPGCMTVPPGRQTRAPVLGLSTPGPQRPTVAARSAQQHPRVGPDPLPWVRARPDHRHPLAASPPARGWILPGIVEADDLGTTWSVPGAGQGTARARGRGDRRIARRAAWTAGAADGGRRPAVEHCPLRGRRRGPGTCSTPAPAPTSASTSSRAPSGTTAPRPPPPSEAALTRWLDAYPPMSTARGPTPEPSRLAPRPLAHRPRRRALLPFRLAAPLPDPQRYAAQPFDASGHVLRGRGSPAGTVHDEGGGRPDARGPLRHRRHCARGVAPRTTDWLPTPTPCARHTSIIWRPPGEPDSVAVMTTLSHPYQYVVIRCVPALDRGEFVNVAVVLHSQSADVLAIEAHVDEARLRCPHTNVDVDGVRAELPTPADICAGRQGAGLPVLPHGRQEVRLDQCTAQHRPAARSTPGRVLRSAGRPDRPHRRHGPLALSLPSGRPHSARHPWGRARSPQCPGSCRRRLPGHRRCASPTSLARRRRAPRPRPPLEIALNCLLRALAAGFSTAPSASAPDTADWRASAAAATAVAAAPTSGAGDGLVALETAWVWARVKGWLTA